MVCTAIFHDIYIPPGTETGWTFAFVEDLGVFCSAQQLLSMRGSTRGQTSQVADNQLVNRYTWTPTEPNKHGTCLELTMQSTCWCTVLHHVAQWFVRDLAGYKAQRKLLLGKTCTTLLPAAADSYIIAVFNCLLSSHTIIQILLGTVNRKLIAVY